MAEQQEQLSTFNGFGIVSESYWHVSKQVWGV